MYLFPHSANTRKIVLILGPGFAHLFTTVAADTFIKALGFSNQSTVVYIVNIEQSHARGRHCVGIIQDICGKFELFNPLKLGQFEYANLNMFGSLAFISQAHQNLMTNTNAPI